MYLHLLHLKISVWKWTWSLQLNEQPVRGWKSVFNRKEHVRFHIFIHSSKYDSLHIFQFNSIQFKIYMFEIFCETVKGLNLGVKGLTDGQPVTSQLNWPIRSITRVQHHQLTWYNSLWLWRWLPHRLLKCQSLSTTTVLSRTMFTRTIILNLLINFLWLTSTVTVTLWELTCYKAYYW